MSFLAISLFDTYDVLSYIFIVKSIIKSFRPYIPLVVFFCVLGYLAGLLMPRLPRATNEFSGVFTYLFFLVDFICSFRFVSRMVLIFYLTMIAMHVTGRFYWLNKSDLDWGL